MRDTNNWTRCHCDRVAKFTVEKKGYGSTRKAVCQLHLVWMVGQMLSGSWENYTLEVKKI